MYKNLDNIKSETDPEKEKSTGGNKWTPEQSMAIHTRQCSLLVAAAAGSGKTAVLVERIIKIILNREHPVDIDKLLVVTFTNAAAAEMRERIGDAVTRELDKNPDSRQLQRQITLLNKANITTIHSFCLDVIKNNFHKLDIDPNFRIADATEAVLLKQETLQELFETKYDEEMSGDREESIFLKLVDSFGGNRDDSTLQGIVLSLFNFVMSGPWPEEWLRMAAENYNLSTDGETLDFGETQWGQVLEENLEIELEGLKISMLKALSIIERNESLAPYTDNFTNDAARLSELLESCGGAWQKLYDSFNEVEFGRLKAARNADKNAAETVKKIRDDAKKKITKLKEELFSIPPESLAKSMTEMYPLIKCLTELVVEFKKSYSVKKKEKALLDFNDLEHFCLSILTETDENNNVVPSETALRLRANFEEILIDEYQDSNNVQEVIMNMVSRAQEDIPNVFMVGDVKQSIYRFRQAEPGLFLNKYQNYSQEEGAKQRKITLYKNFRSRKEVIDCVNFIFKNVMSENIGELEYSDDEALNLGASFPPLNRVMDDGQQLMDNGQWTMDNEEGSQSGGESIGKLGNREIEQLGNWPVELHIIEKKRSVKVSGMEIGGEGLDGDEESGDDEAVGTVGSGGLGSGGFGENGLGQDYGAGPDSGGEGDSGPLNRFAEAAEDLDNVQIEARVVGKRIKELMASGGGRGFSVYDKNLKDYRPVQYRDIVILMRATAGWSGVFMEELNELGIPVYADTGTGYFQTLEVQTMMSLLQIIDNPMQDIPLLAVLRSPIFAFSAEELIDIRLADKNIPFYQALKKISEGETEKVRSFFKALNQWREAAQHMPIDELIWYLYNETGYYAYAGAMVNGMQRQANLRILFERAKQYEETSFKGLFNFINFINKLKKSSGDLGSAKILGENENVVRIMSIHKSKGLEFPVVILAGAGKNFNLSDMRKNILFHQKLGIGSDYVDAKRRITYPTIIKQALKKKIKLENLSEEMRVLYVALTRAKEKLIITGSVNDIGRNSAKWTSEISSTKLPEYIIIKGKNYLDWICPVVAQHKEVTALRAYAGLDESPDLDLKEDPSEWVVKFWQPEDLFQKESGKTIPEEAFLIDTEIIAEGMHGGEFAGSELAGSELAGSKLAGRELAGRELAGRGAAEYAASPFSAAINNRLNWQYEYMEASRLPAKISVTELKRRINLLPEDEHTTNTFVAPMIRKPLFLEEEKVLTSAERGTAVHTLMQHIDLKKEINIDNVNIRIQQLVKNEILSPEQGKAINASKILKFFSSEIGRRMLSSTVVKREVPFFIRLRSTEIYKELPPDKYSDEIILLQGIIDCCFIEDGEIILLDYKTDYVPDGNTEIIAERYRTQLDYYSKALTAMTGQKVKARYIYLFSLDRAVEIF